MTMAPYSLGELSTAVVIILGAAGGLLAVCFKSRCDQIRLCWGCCDVHREVASTDETADIENPPDAPPPVTAAPARASGT